MKNGKSIILVVEDEPEVKDSIEEILQLNNYDVITASNVPSALEILKTKKLDLVVSDILMPGESGLDLLKKVRAIPELFSLPFIFLTAQSDIVNIRAGMNRGADDYLVKPFSASDLLNSIKLRLQKKNHFDEKMNLILSGISQYVPHELRTPLVAILGYPEFILENFDEMEKGEIFEMLERIRFGGHRMLNTLEKFILFSDLESSKLRPENLTEADFSMELNYLINLAVDKEKKKQDKQQQFTINVQDQKIKISENHLEIVLQQLIENAVKFTDDGRRIKIIGAKSNNYYKIEITDQGTGMSAEELALISPFIQFNRNERQQAGNGLGLSIVSKIIELYEGKMEISSDKKIGTTVSLFFKLI